MPEKISITDKETYRATVLYHMYSGEYSLRFSVDHFREKLKRFAFPHVVFHEVSHVWDFLKHGRLIDTIEQCWSRAKIANSGRVKIAKISRLKTANPQQYHRNLS